MKKSLLILGFLIAFSNVINAQQVSIYKIDTVASSNGMTINAPWYFKVNTACLENIDGNWFINSYVVTYLDILNIVPIKNDSIPSFNAISIPESDYNSLSNPELGTKYIEGNLKNIYGINNVTKIE